MNGKLDLPFYSKNLRKNVGDGFTNAVLGRIEGSLLHFIGGFGVDSHGRVNRGV